MLRRPVKPGDVVVYRKDKHSTHPGPRARAIRAAPKGEIYSYQVEKFWVVAQVQDDANLLLKTRRGKSHIVDRDDPQLRHVTWWDWLWYGSRFRDLKADSTAHATRAAR